MSDDAAKRLLAAAASHGRDELERERADAAATQSELARQAQEQAARDRAVGEAIHARQRLIDAFIELVSGRVTPEELPPDTLTELVFKRRRRRGWRVGEALHSEMPAVKGTGGWRKTEPVFVSEDGTMGVLRGRDPHWAPCHARDIDEIERWFARFLARHGIVG
jgi:hypothetical protein